MKVSTFGSAMYKAKAAAKEEAKKKRLTRGGERAFKRGGIAGFGKYTARKTKQADQKEKRLAKGAEAKAATKSKVGKIREQFGSRKAES